MDRRQFTLALAGLGMQAVSGEATGCTRAVGPADYLLPTLRRYAKWPWPQRVRAAMPLLSPQGDFVPLLIEALADDDPEMRLLAIDLVEEIEPDERSLPALVNALDDSDEIVQIFAVDPVLRFGKKAKAALPALRRWLSGNGSTPSRQEWFRLTAAAAITRIDPDQIQEMLPVLLVTLESQSPLCHLVAAEVLGDLGKAAVVALPRLEELLREDPDNSSFAEAILKIDAEVAYDPRQRWLPGM